MFNFVFTNYPDKLIEFVIKPGQNVPDNLAQAVVKANIQNTTGSFIQNHDGVICVSSDNTTCDRGENVVHQVFDCGDLGKTGPDTLKQARVLNSNSSLICKCV